MYGLGRIALLLIVAGIAAFGLWQTAIRWHPAVEDFPIQGVDVGEANGAIEWNAVAAAGADFAYAVATRGAGQRDRAFEANWAAIDAAGLRRGAVHLWSFCQRATDQADAFNTVVPRDAAALPAVIALEYDDACTARPDRDVLVNEIAHAAVMIETHLGKPVLLRIARAVERDYGLSERIPRPLWAVGNFFAPDYTARPWRIWRTSDMRRIDGIAGPVNWNVAAK